MLDDQDIQKCLEKIKISKADNRNVAREVYSHNSIPSSDIVIDPTCDIRGIERMSFGKSVVIQKDCWLNIAFHNPVKGPMIVIDEGTNIGRRCIISAANRIFIGKFVLIAPNVFIADTHHEYQRIGIPIMYQGITTHTDRITIGDEAWIGINTVIMGNVTVGKHSVIGANSVVNRDVPDYSVAAGNPAKIVKMFDLKTGQWVKVEDKVDLDRYLSARCERFSEDTEKIKKKEDR
jgi:acetyltransferase-like isoleucine patch superfamily enzyme